MELKIGHEHVYCLMMTDEKSPSDIFVMAASFIRSSQSVDLIKSQHNIYLLSCLDILVNKKQPCLTFRVFRGRMVISQ